MKKAIEKSFENFEIHNTSNLTGALQGARARI
jgi:hypothetical protein